METQRPGRFLSTSHSRSFTTTYAVRLRSGLELTPTTKASPRFREGSSFHQGRRPRPAPKGEPRPAQLERGRRGGGVRPRAAGQAHAPTRTDFLVLTPEPPRPPERKLGRAREPRPLQSPRAATCGSVPAELRAAGGKGAGQLSKKSWLPRLRSPRTDRCGPRCPGRSAPSSACPCRPPDASSRLSSADRSSGCAAPAPPPAANHGEPRPGTCPPARPACPAPATPPAPAPGGDPGRTGRVLVK